MRWTCTSPSLVFSRASQQETRKKGVAGVCVWCRVCVCELSISVIGTLDHECAVRRISAGYKCKA